MGWTEREKEIRGERKRSYDLRDAKRENGEYWEKREIGLAGEKINEKIRLGSRRGGRLKKKRRRKTAGVGKTTMRRQ